MLDTPPFPRYSKLLLQTLRAPAALYFAITGNFVLIGSILAFHGFEHDVNPTVKGWMDSIWWGISTVTTVGFGDVTPISTGGRLVGIFLMIAGVSLFVGSTALMVSGFLARLGQEIQHSERLSYSEYQQIIAHLEKVSSRIEVLESRLRRSEAGRDTE